MTISRAFFYLLYFNSLNVSTKSFHNMKKEKLFHICWCECKCFLIKEKNEISPHGNIKKFRYTTDNVFCKSSHILAIRKVTTKFLVCDLRCLCKNNETPWFFLYSILIWLQTHTKEKILVWYFIIVEWKNIHGLLFPCNDGVNLKI